MPQLLNFRGKRPIELEAGSGREEKNFCPCLKSTPISRSFSPQRSRCTDWAAVYSDTKPENTRCKQDVAVWNVKEGIAYRSHSTSTINTGHYNFICGESKKITKDIDQRMEGPVHLWACSICLKFRLGNPHECLGPSYTKFCTLLLYTDTEFAYV